MIFVIEDDDIMRECIVRATGQTCREFSDAINAMYALDDERPSLIFLDILLDGPDGFTFLQELASHTDLAQIPVIVVTSLDLPDLSDYGVRAILKKDQMTPQEIAKYVREYA